MTLTKHTTIIQTRSAFIIFAGMCGVIAIVLFFQHQLGYIPCKLCFGQREPYYAAIPVSFLAFLSAFNNWPACLTRGLLAICGLLMLYAMFLAIHHAGIEWSWWEGPSDCGAVGGEIINSDDLLAQLDTKIPPSCNEAAGRFLGLSFAGWNVIASAMLGAIAFYGAFYEEK